MKKIYALLLVTMFTICTGSFAADGTEQTAAKVDSALAATSETATNIHQTLDALHVDFGSATTAKDSLFAILETLSTDTEVAKIKGGILEVYEIGEENKAATGSYWSQDYVKALIGVLLLIVGWLSRHFGFLRGKKQ